MDSAPGSPIRLKCLQHAAFDGPAFLPRWAREKGHFLDPLQVAGGARLPRLADFDGLIVMGGPMSLRDERTHRWIAAECRLVEQALNADKPVFGICLGAQMLAHVLGAPVSAGSHPEIGWFPVRLTEAAAESWPGASLPTEFISFFWHQDTFGIPDGAIHIASTDAYENQGFVWGPHAALQFHLEVTPEWAAMLVARDADQLNEHRFVQSAETILIRTEQLSRHNNAIMSNILDRWIANSTGNKNEDV
ncbi:MAG: type 1 glutamine amidotransferase [Gammaproteobacteria bacterium]